MKVVAIEAGYFRGRRRKGDVFDVPFTKKKIEKSKWMRIPSEAKIEERVIPISRGASMVDAIKGVAFNKPPETRSEMTQALLADEEKHGKAHGIPEESP